MRADTCLVLTLHADTLLLAAHEGEKLLVTLYLRQLLYSRPEDTGRRPTCSQAETSS